MTWTRVRLWKPLKKGLKTSLVFQHRFGKILLDRIYKCVLFENFNKLFCYWKLKDNFFPSCWVLQLLWQLRLSFRFSTLYLPLTSPCEMIKQEEHFFQKYSKLVLVCVAMQLDNVLGSIVFSGMGFKRCESEFYEFYSKWTYRFGCM